MADIERNNNYNNLQHPCYNSSIKSKIARMHLPVAARCNMQCNYCSRNYACYNENRPGVCSKLLMPDKVVDYIKNAILQYPEIKIVGIAGPAEPLADMEIFLETCYQVKSNFPDLSLCMATNGLVLAENIDEIRAAGVQFITITINSININNIKNIYSYIEYKEKIYKGTEMALLLNEQQTKALQALAKTGIPFKINTVAITGLNITEIKDISQLGKQHGATAINIIPHLPVKGSRFQDLPQVNPQDLDNVREESESYLKVITHCRRCRADAIGFL